MTIRNCFQCSNWNRCRKGYDWYYPSEVDGRYCYHQVIFLIMARDAIFFITWPKEPSGYIDQGYALPGSHAPFELSVAVVCVTFLRRWVLLLRSRKARNNVRKLEEELRANIPFYQLSFESRTMVEYLVKDRREGYAHFIDKKRVYNPL